MRAAIALLCFLVACTDLSSEDDGSYVDIVVTSDVPFTGLFVFEPFQTVSGAGILTPGLRTAGKPAPGTAMIESTEGMRGIGNGQLGTSYEMKRWDIAGGPSRLSVLAVVMQPDGSFVPVAFAETARLEYQPKDGGAVEASGTMQLAPLTGPAELWGTGTTCVRMVDDATGTTTYLVRSDDLDCDGISDESDCNPRAFCDGPGCTGGC